MNTKTRVYLLNRKNDKDTVTYIDADKLQHFNEGSLADILKLMTQPAIEATLDRLEGLYHEAACIEARLKHHSYIEFMR